MKGSDVSFVATAARSLRQSISGSPWHGPSIESLIADVTADEAAQKPLGSHSILELVLHIAVWIEETASRLNGSAAAVPEAGDWPVPDPDPEVAWKKAAGWLSSAGRALDTATTAFSASRLDEIVGAKPDSPEGSAVSYGTMLIGLAEHNAYHGGQIGLLKRAIRSAAR